MNTSSEAANVWDKVITQFGQTTGSSRYSGYSVALDERRLGVGAEYHSSFENYRWHGLRRGGSASNHWVCFQWTVEGEGVLRVGKKEYPQTAGEAFLVHVPSDHEYRVANPGPGWKFFYVMISMPWLADRLAAASRELDYTFPLPCSSRLGVETLHLIQQTYAEVLEDRFEAERAALNWMVELRRHLYQIRHPEDGREAMLARARQFYDKHKTHSFGVEDFAHSLGMSRVRASLQFQRLTGQSPAAHFMELRLKDAITLLGQGLKLQEVSRQTGFADANHFCKVFRRVYHVSPGQFRKMIGVKRPPTE